SASPNKTPQPTHNYHRYMDEPVTRGSREHVDGLTSAIVEVRGQIQLPDGAPASSATVELVHHAPGIDRSRVVETTQTEASGNYVIRGEDHRELALRVSGDFPTA